MLPTFKENQLLLIRRSQFVVGDVVLFVHDGLEKVKRVAVIDGERVLLLGDNPSESTDGRHFGQLPLASIRGKVVWPRMLVCVRASSVN
jgi:phage repressor protein C with HTH and peptisase S24 domain